MDKLELQQNADFLSIAMEQINNDDVAYEFVEEVYHNLLDEIEEQ
jgi:hypothetical protein